MGYITKREEQQQQQHLVDWAENLDDISYDGQVDGPHTVAGLGQLVDGITNDNRTSPNGTFFGKSFIFLKIYLKRNLKRAGLLFKLRLNEFKILMY